MSSRNELLNDPEEALRLALDGRQSSIYTSMPGIVISVNLAKMTCEVQIAIQGIIQNEDGTEKNVPLPPLLDVPIVFPSCGNFIITMPLAAGDEVLVCFASRCIDSWWQNGGVGVPLEARMHDLSDGFAIPGPRSSPNVVSGISSTGLQIRNKDGTTFIEIASDGKIKLVSPSEIDVTAPLVKVTGAMVVTGAVTTGALTAATLATSGGGSATIAGNMNVTGDVTAAEVTAGSIALSTHIHGGVQTGGGDTGVPIP